MNDITVEELKDKIENNEDVLILDVRQMFEKFQSSIDYDDAILISLGELPNRMEELEPHRDREIVCLCRSGVRSEKARQLLAEKGFENVKNLKGGINEWARKIDPSLPVY